MLHFLNPLKWGKHEEEQTVAMGNGHSNQWEWPIRMVIVTMAIRKAMASDVVGHGDSNGHGNDARPINSKCHGDGGIMAMATRVLTSYSFPIKSKAAFETIPFDVQKNPAWQESSF
jgi:hypothetical protein